MEGFWSAKWVLELRAGGEPEQMMAQVERLHYRLEEIGHEVKGKPKAE